jgi:CRP/FNR family cyclic AMP-dependent transcriptional regulator
VAEEIEDMREGDRSRLKSLKIPVRVRTDDGKLDKYFDDYVLELAKERIYIKTTDPLPVNTRVHLAFDIPGAPNIVHLKGEVVRINTSPPSGADGLEPGMGVIFEQVGFDDRNIINEYLKTIESEDHQEEYSTFITWIQRISRPMTPAERERIKKDMLKALYGGGRGKAAVPSSARRKSREDLEVMARIPLFKDFDDVELDEVARIAIKEKFRAGDIVFNEGDKGDKFYIILQGSVDVTKRISDNETQTLVTLKPGDYFGEMSLIDEAPRSAGIRAKEDLTLLSISRHDLELLLNASSSISSKIYIFFVQTLVKRLRDTNEKIKQFIMMTGSGQL